jgi:hypothetical protein
MVIAIGFFVLAALLIVVLGLRDRRKLEGPSAEPATSSTGSAAAAETTAPRAPTADSVGATPPAIETSTPPPVAPPAATSTKAMRVPQPSASPRTVAAAHPAPPPPPPPEEKDPGFLTINVYPWAKVSEGGRVLCAATPCNKIQLSPGSHTLTLENVEQGVKQTTTVVIKSGETTTRAIGLK